LQTFDIPKIFSNKMEEMQDLDLAHSELIDLNSTEDNQKQLEYQRALEVINQLFISLLDDCLIELPNIAEQKIIKCAEEVSKFLSLHQIYEDKELLDFIGKGVQCSIKDYKWKDFLRQK
jgi:hypothetical protein